MRTWYGKLLTVLVLGLFAVGVARSDDLSGGKVAITKGPTGGDNTISADGTYDVKQDWTPTVTLFCMSKDGGLFRSGAADLNMANKTWSATITGVPSGTYFVWAILDAQLNVGGNVTDEYFATPVTQNLGVTGNANGDGKTAGGSIGWANGQPSAKGTNGVQGNGPLAVDGANGWASLDQGLILWALPINGGRVVQSVPVKGNPPTWSSSMSGLTAGTTYNVIATNAIQQNNNKATNQTVGTTYKSFVVAQP